MKCVAKEKYILMDVHYCHVSQIGNIYLEPEAPIVSDDHLEMGKIDSEFRIGHFPYPFLSSSTQRFYSTVRSRCLGCSLYTCALAAV